MNPIRGDDISLVCLENALPRRMRHDGANKWHVSIYCQDIFQPSKQVVA